MTTDAKTFPLRQSFPEKARSQPIRQDTQETHLRTVQELLGHNDVKTTMIYTHVLNWGPAGVSSPLDGL